MVLSLFLMPETSKANLLSADKVFMEEQTPDRDRRLSIKLYKKKLFFSSLSFAKNYIAEAEKIDPKFEIYLEKLILKTGTMSFSYMQEKILKRHSASPSIALAYAFRLSKKKRWDEVLKVVKNIPDHHRFASEARMLEGAAHKINSNDLEAEKSYKNCFKVAKELEGISNAEKQGRYYAIIKESCAIHLARIEYRNANYEKAMELYNSIPKTSYRWPFTLIEKAWTAYQLEDYNRTLGIIVTYKSPLLSSYFFPEAEVLSSLSYLRLCLYDDSLNTIKQYYSVYRTRSDALKKLLVKHKKSHTYFLKMMFAPIQVVEKLNPYIRNLMTQVRKKIKFSIDLVSYKRLQNELKYLRKEPTGKLSSILQEELKETIRWRTTHLNHFIKKKMFDFINEIHKQSYEMFNIKLEILAKKRDLVWKNKKLISNRSRGSHENVKRKVEEHFYDFRGEFWADELGDYSFGLKSNCSSVRTSRNNNQDSK